MQGLSNLNVNENILKFSKFLDSYKDNYGKKSSEISIPDPNNEDDNYVDKYIPLVSSDYIMLDFDSICKDADFYPKSNKKKCNRPSTVDALYYRIINESKIQLFLVEFKSFYYEWDSYGDYVSSLMKIICNIPGDNINDMYTLGINRLNSIRKTFGNTIEFSLRLKPYESLFVVLPKIYDEYCYENNIAENDKLNLNDFFKSNFCDVILFIVGKSSDDSSKDNLGKLGNTLNKQYKRLEFVNVLSTHKLFVESDFDDTAEVFKEDEMKTIKSLNNPGSI